MKLSIRTSHNPLRLLAVGLAAAAIAVPAAQAYVLPDYGGPSLEQLEEFSFTGSGYVGPSLDQLQEFSFDGPSTSPGLPSPAGGVASQTTSGGAFDWQDAGIGLAVGVGVTVILSGLVLLGARRRDRLARA